MKRITALSILLETISQIYAYSSGAPATVCNNLQPQHYGVFAQTSSSPFSISVSTDQINQGDSVTVSVTGSDFVGFVLVGVDSTSNHYVGEFESPPSGAYKIGPCKETIGGAYLASITHTSSATKSSLTVSWSPPTGYTGTVCIKGSIAKAKTQWWGVLTSTQCVTVSEATTTTAAPTTTSTTPTTTTPTPTTTTKATTTSTATMTSATTTANTESAVSGGLSSINTATESDDPTTSTDSVSRVEQTTKSSETTTGVSKRISYEGGVVTLCLFVLVYFHT